MINIDFYKYTGEPNTVNKALDNPIKLIGNFYREVNLTRLEIVISGDIVKQCNYCYIQELNRYYFIDSVTLLESGLYKLVLILDTLKTYENIITHATGTITESSTADRYISNRTNVIDKRPQFTQLNFLADLFTNDGEIIMVTLKGK